MSRRNPRGSTAAKRRKRIHDARTSRPEYHGSGFWKSLSTLNDGLGTAITGAIRRVLGQQYVSGEREHD